LGPLRDHGRRPFLVRHPEARARPAADGTPGPAHQRLGLRPRPAPAGGHAPVLPRRRGGQRRRPRSLFHRGRRAEGDPRRPRRGGGAYRFDVRLQGEGQTAFFEFAG
jgi:hypothetical protein